MKDQLNKRLKELEEGRIREDAPQNWEIIHKRLYDNSVNISVLGYWNKVAAALIILAVLSVVFYWVAPKPKSELALKSSESDAVQSVNVEKKPEPITMKQNNTFEENVMTSSERSAPDNTAKPLQKLGTKIKSSNAPQTAEGKSQEFRTLTKAGSEGKGISVPSPAPSRETFSAAREVTGSAENKVSLRDGGQNQGKLNWTGTFDGMPYNAIISQNKNSWIFKGIKSNKSVPIHIFRITGTQLTFEIENKIFIYSKVGTENSGDIFNGDQGTISVASKNEFIRIEMKDKAGNKHIWELQPSYE